ncbi:MAG: GNAT family N-acetyltransferase [Candidatus Thorarchaeota archaeon]
MESWDFKAKDGRPILVRHAQRKDASLLYQGFKEVVSEGKWLPTFTANSSISDWLHWIDKTNHSREVLLVAFLDGEYAGHLTLQPEEWNASQHVAKLGIIVCKNHRNLGVGRSLMISAEEVAHSRAYFKIVLSTFEDNLAAKHLYTSLGYRLVGVRKNHFDMPKGFIDEVLMEKELVEAQSRVL